MRARLLLGFVLAAFLCCSSVSAFAATPLTFGKQGAILLATDVATLRAAKVVGKGHQPSLAPGGQQVVWVESGKKEGEDRILLYDARTNQTTPLANASNAFLTFPRWSPDGKSVAYVRSSPSGPREIWLVTPGGEPRRIAQQGADTGDDFFEPTWAPDGTRILYHDMSALFFMTLDGKIVQKIPLPEIYGGDAKLFTSADRFVLRPGGSGEILFSVGLIGTPLFQKKVPDISSGLFLYDPRTRKSAALTPQSLTAFAPTWSPDGATLYFTGYTDKQAGGEYPFRVFSLQPGAAASELAPGEDPAPPSGP
jgi:Tol biopolymer transport system component